MRVAILTDLERMDDAYSVCSVVRDQMRIFNDYGVTHTLFVRKRFHGDIPQSTQSVLTHIKPYHYDEDEEPLTRFKEEVDSLVSGDSRGVGYRAALTGCDTVITHDLVNSSWNLPHNRAIRKVASECPKKWFHWCHSNVGTHHDHVRYPSSMKYEAMDGTYVFPNEAAAARASEVIHGSKTAVCYNPRDVRDLFSFSRETTHLIRAWDLFDHDIMQVYPFVMPRWREKGVPHLLTLFGDIKRRHKRVKLILVNAQADSDFGRQEIEIIRAKARRCRLEEGVDYFLTSMVPFEGWARTVPQSVVHDLMVMSNVFVFPSAIECCSLVQAEAAVMGKLLVLNSDYAPMFEYATQTTMAYPFSQNDPDKDGVFYKRVAGLLAAELEKDRILTQKTYSQNCVCNRDWIWKNQLKPLLEEIDGDS